MQFDFPSFLEDFSESPLGEATARARNERGSDISAWEHSTAAWKFYRDGPMSSRSDRQKLLTSLACAFGDVGKTVVSHEDAFGRSPHVGHELQSSRIWENYAVDSWHEMRRRFSDLLPHDIFSIGWMLQNQSRYTEDLDLGRFKRVVFQTLGRDSIAFLDFMDARHRNPVVSNAREKYETARKRFMDSAPTSTTPPTYYKECLLLVGPYGSGKTLFALERSHGMNVASSDTMLEEWGNFIAVRRQVDTSKMSTADRDGLYSGWAQDLRTEFQSHLKHEIDRLMTCDGDVIIDSNNLSKGDRRRLAMQARRNGFFVRVILFPASKQQLVMRTMRPDKHVVPEDVIRQFDALELPDVTVDADAVVVSSNNLIP